MVIFVLGWICSTKRHIRARLAPFLRVSALVTYDVVRSLASHLKECHIEKFAGYTIADSEGAVIGFSLYKLLYNYCNLL